MHRTEAPEDLWLRVEVTTSAKDKYWANIGIICSSESRDKAEGVVELNYRNELAPPCPGAEVPEEAALSFYHHVHLDRQDSN